MLAKNYCIVDKLTDSTIAGSSNANRNTEMAQLLDHMAPSSTRTKKQ
jgi:hypothetical protein